MIMIMKTPRSDNIFYEWSIELKDEKESPTPTDILRRPLGDS